MKSVTVTLMSCACLFFAATAIGQPRENISPKIHANLAEAQDHIKMAYNKITEAQAANDDRLGGHGNRAKALLDQADAELKAAAEAANAWDRAHGKNP